MKMRSKFIPRHFKLAKVTSRVGYDDLFHILVKRIIFKHLNIFNIKLSLLNIFFIPINFTLNM
ncbi:hypothetical protein HERIO_2277 [Hepatospora eriocheir]|uniref:Uncharacterized protein n=1 Tax=Hepatospora eriocheir TaxID=1081669 RepID=A0A1X0Q7J1_9MICR|nr:hypothetical protein HERIO_2277 [Hepatospora eriocheir]